MAREERRGRVAPAIALLLGVAIVLAHAIALRGVAYPYSGDSASYVEMARTLLDDGRPRVTPWGLESPAQDAVPQPLFPPGYPLLIAAVASVAGDVHAAAPWPSRLAAALLPLLVLLLFRGCAPDAALVGAGLWALLSPGVLKWHFVAYSDVACLALAIVALGALLRAEGTRTRWLVASGVAAGCAYAVRNAALAVLAAACFALLVEALLQRAWRPLATWLAGAALPLGALFAYSLATFGSLQPYSMAPSSRAWTVNATDWVRAQLVDLHVPASLVAELGTATAFAIAAAALALGALWAWRERTDARRLRLVLALGGYVGAGAVLLVASRSRYEWADTIEPRHALQYSWAIAVLVVAAVHAHAAPRLRRALGAAGLAGLAFAGGFAVAHVRAQRAAGPEPWAIVAGDAQVVHALRALPPGTFIASNAAVLFRLASARAVRLAEFGGGDAAFDASLAQVRTAAGPRAAAYVLWCHEYTRDASACAAVARDSGPACRRLRGPPQVVALCEVPRGPAEPAQAVATPLR